jgi:hypothetical protein
VGLLVAAGVVAIAGVISAVVIALAIALPVLVVAIALAAAGLRDALGDRRSRILEELRALDAELGTTQIAADSITERIAEATNRATAAGLPPDPAALIALAADVEQAATGASARQQWSNVRDRLAGEVGAAEGALRAALIGRGIVEAGDLELATTCYREAVTNRGAVARQAARRPDLERELASRRHAEAATEAAAKHRTDAADQVVLITQDLGLGTLDFPATLLALRAWQERNHQEVERAQAQLRMRGQLDSMLAGRTITALEDEAQQDRARADAASTGLPIDEVNAAANDADLESQRTGAATTLHQAREAAREARGELRHLSATPANVSTTQEAMAAAQAELERLGRLDATLTTTRQFLGRAQERVHRDIAPILERTLHEWLPRITRARYSDASVDPETLEVRVKDTGGRFREAALLSQGTREQIYLLLRMALVRHLTKSGEISPLIFDDVTAQSDAPRTQAILALLHEAAAQSQIIVFSKDEQVQTWAEANLTSPNDRLQVLGESEPPS